MQVSAGMNVFNAIAARAALHNNSPPKIRGVVLNESHLTDAVKNLGVLRIILTGPADYHRHQRNKHN